MIPPRPYYNDGRIVIYNGDCAKIAPALQNFDLLLTDPPYGIGEAKGANKSRSKLAKAKDYGVADWDDAPLNADLLSLLISKADQQIVFGGNYFTLPPSKCWLVWDKMNGKNDFADCELAWTNLNKAVRMIKYRWAGMLQGDMKNKEIRVHPTQKPLIVMQWAIEQAGQCETIFDPFMGSGTTLLAAKSLGRKAVGIEREEKYCKAAVERLRQDFLI